MASGQKADHGSSSPAGIAVSADSTPEQDRVAWQLAVEAAGIGAFYWDQTTGTLVWDERLIALFGYDHDDFEQTIEAFQARVHPDDLPRVMQALQSAIDSCGDFVAEYRIVLPHGGTRWIAARGRALANQAGTPVRLIGAAYDTTPAHEQQVRFTRVLESMSAAFYSLDREWRFTYVNAEAERILGRTREELLGGVVWELFPAALGSDFESNYRHAMDSGSPVAFDAYYPAPLNGWYELRVWPAPDGLSVYFLDITDRRAVQEQTERAARRAALLSSVTAELTETLDPEEAVARLAQLVVPTLADWCIVTLVDDQQSGGHRGMRDVGSWHADPDVRPVVAQYACVRLDALVDDSYLLRVLRSGQPAVIPSGATEAIARVLGTDRARALVHRLAPEAVLVLPLRGRGRTVGLITLFNGASRGVVAGDDFEVALELAGRAGLALDNARLYRQQRDLAGALQRSLLTKPPEPDHTQIVVRYEPASEAAQVGGDWYDAFLQSDGATMLVIGDVIGHDTDAAAAMGQVRTLLRGVAVATGQGPAELLGTVDAVMQTLQVDTTASAVVARLEQTPQQRADSVTTVRWSNAGHPPPLVLGGDGTVSELGGSEADLLLGIDPASDRCEFTASLNRGDTVLLYTDGLVERRGQSLDVGLAKLREVLGELSGMTLQRLCDEVLVRMLPPAPEDDVALLGVRLHPQDQPRPVEAGPQRVPPGVPVE